MSQCVYLILYSLLYSYIYVIVRLSFELFMPINVEWGTKLIILEDA